MISQWKDKFNAESDSRKMLDDNLRVLARRVSELELEAQDKADKIADAMANEIGTAHLAVDALVLFEQPSTGEPFRIIRRAAMSSPLDQR